VGGAAVQALLAGADMVMALGERATQQETLSALAQCIESGAIANDALQQRLQRLNQLAQRYPAQGQPYGALQEQNDHDLMRRAWQRALTLHPQAGQAPHAPAPGSAVRVVVRADASSDGVSEAGLSAQDLLYWLRQHYDVAITTFDTPEQLHWQDLPDDGRYVMLASTSRKRYGDHARRNWRPALHLCLWNPFQALDIDAPAVVSYGFAAPALQAVGDWFHGRFVPQASNPCLVQSG
ncbi:MAG: hypothetical protein RL748_3370, partial [Pseudomonadota bacterium]